ncbi:MAG: sigma-70 family RNA polymerase sigma factor [Bacillota bacterium]|nr:sigma-70 family RNA polymerase sigma factor [Bacillota bacterium]
MLTNQGEDLVLLEKARRGDQSAVEGLVKKYTPLVRYIARNYYVRCMEFDDLMQEGMIGLLHAIQEYDQSRYDKIKFSSFAYLCILRRIYNILKQSNGNKQRALNEAVSLFSYANQEETRQVVDLVESEDRRLNPEEMAERKYVESRIQEVLRHHLSLLEYTVITFLLAGYSYGEIQREIGVNVKVIDNARTRVRLKIRRLLQKYGSLLNPKALQRVRRRKDLYHPLSLAYARPAWPDLLSNDLP